MSGIEILKAIQSINSPFLDRFFGIMTDLHHADFYLLLFPLLLWLYDKRFTRYLVSVFLLGTWSNGALKTWLGTDRPPADLVRKLYPESGIGPAFPSGHAQNPLMFWGAIALQFHRRWLTWGLGVLIFLIGYSRLYAGLHWPLDVLGGWLIGAAMLTGFECTRSFWLGDRMSLATRLAVAVGVPLLALVIWRTGNWNSPATEVGETWKLTGAYLGFWVGSLLEEEYVGFDPRAGGWQTHAMKLIVGVIVVFGVRFGLKPLLPAVALSDTIRYGIITLFATYLLPWVFQRFLTPVSPGHPVSRSHNF